MRTVTVTAKDKDKQTITDFYPEHVIQWQLDRMDMTRDNEGNWIEGEPTREDAIALLDSLDD